MPLFVLVAVVLGFERSPAMRNYKRCKMYALKLGSNKLNFISWLLGKQKNGSSISADNESTGVIISLGRT